MILRINLMVLWRVPLNRISVAIAVVATFVKWLKAVDRSLKGFDKKPCTEQIGFADNLFTAVVYVLCSDYFPGLWRK
ncbi:hypothetical protein L0244_31320 [bacterium]|nr:hypothetical protein [bacterium]